MPVPLQRRAVGLFRAHAHGDRGPGLDRRFRPLLLARYPDLSEEQVTEAHAYAYGGALIQDLGYYPFGSLEFSDLLHYVRSGDFVRELLRQSQDANEYAFALGALSHYTSDIAGHPAVNTAVSMGYPKLRAKYGKSVRYAQGKTAHMKTEFGFDMVQVAKNRYASEHYHDFIGFKLDLPNRDLDDGDGTRAAEYSLADTCTPPCSRDSPNGIST